jgi:hypothetical protein
LHRKRRAHRVAHNSHEISDNNKKENTANGELQAMAGGWGQDTGGKFDHAVKDEQLGNAVK